MHTRPFQIEGEMLREAKKIHDDPTLRLPCDPDRNPEKTSKIVNILWNGYIS
jgi:hypothetical protein